MTNEEAKKMLKAKLECFKNETSGINHDCNMRLCDGCSLNYEQGNMGEQKEALDMAIKALEQTRWIPVSERLPKDHENVLIYLSSNIITIGLYNSHRLPFRDEPLGWGVDAQISVYNFCSDDVVAWMPLPEPYKEENNEQTRT